MPFLRNRWYCAVWSHELAPGPHAPKPLARKLLGEDIVFWRTATGKIVALADYCPHRFAPLSFGNVEGDLLKCRYHGLAFNAEGRCASDPSGAKPPPMKIKSYPVEEKHGMIYIWIGDAEPDCAAPDWLDFGPGYGGTLRDMLPVKANYQLLVDNLLDDAHATHLHVLLGTEAHIARPKTEVIDEGDKVKSNTDLSDTSCVPLFRALRGRPGNVDQFIRLTWYAPSAINIHVGVYEVGGDPADNVGVNSTHMVTPETEGSCFYYWAFERNARLEDHSLTAMMAKQLKHIFTTEDVWMVEGTQRVLGSDDFWARKPALMLQDRAAVTVRRRIDALVAEQEAKGIAAE